MIVKEWVGIGNRGFLSFPNLIALLLLLAQEEGETDKRVAIFI
jgi:hypothetical protein